jgi:hypothetical protein
MNQSARLVKGTTSPVRRPYFMRKSINRAYYDVSDPALRLAPQTPPESFWIRASYGRVSLLLGHFVLAPKNGSGDVDRPLEVVPSLSVSLSPAGGVIPLTATSFLVSVQVRSNDQRRVEGRFDFCCRRDSIRSRATSGSLFTMRTRYSVFPSM